MCVRTGVRACVCWLYFSAFNFNCTNLKETQLRGGEFIEIFPMKTFERICSALTWALVNPKDCSNLLTRSGSMLSWRTFGELFGFTKSHYQNKKDRIEQIWPNDSIPIDLFAFGSDKTARCEYRFCGLPLGQMENTVHKWRRRRRWKRKQNNPMQPDASEVPLKSDMIFKLYSRVKRFMLLIRSHSRSLTYTHIYMYECFKMISH